MMILVPPELVNSVRKMTIPFAAEIIAKHAVENRKKERFNKVISELRSFQCDDVLTKKQLKEVVMILRECGITKKDFKELESSFADYPYDGWFHKLKQTKHDDRSGLSDYFNSLSLGSEK